MNISSRYLATSRLPVNQGRTFIVQDITLHLSLGPGATKATIQAMWEDSDEQFELTDRQTSDMLERREILAL